MGWFVVGLAWVYHIIRDDDSQGLILFGGVGSANKATSALWGCVQRTCEKMEAHQHTYIYIYLLCIYNITYITYSI